jgi:hypothetical protein
VLITSTEDAPPCTNASSKVLRFLVQKLRTPLQQRDRLYLLQEESALLDCASSLTAEIDAELAQSAFNLSPGISIKVFISNAFAQRLSELQRLRRQDNGSVFPLQTTAPVSQPASTFVTEAAGAKFLQQFPVGFSTTHHILTSPGPSPSQQ